MTDGLELVRLIRTIAADEKGGDPFGDGIAAAVEGNYCSIQGDADAAPTPGFYVVPGLNVIVGDHVLYRNADGFKLVFAVLNRDVLTPYPGGGGEAGHLPVTVGAGLDVTDEQLVSLDLSEVSAGGELGGTLAAPTVDASHSGSTHAETQAAAEATAASALTAHTSDAVAAHAASAISFTPNGSIAATDVQAAIQEVRDEASGGSGAPTTADYLVGTADAGLSGEIVVGTTPGGELGGTWASPTVDASHGGGTHAATQAAAEATAAGALSTHAGAADPHTGYRLESADHTHATTGLQGGTIAHSATTGQTATDHHVAPAAGPDADITVDAAGAAGTASTFARSGHGHKISRGTSIAAVGTANASGTSGHGPASDDHVHAHEAAHLAHDTAWAAKGDLVVGTANDTAGILTAGTNDQILMAESAETTGLKWVSSQTPSTQAYSDAAAEGTADTFARGDHKHGMPAAGGGTTIANDTIWAAKGDIVGATGNDAASVLTVGANDTILMADSAAGNGLKWVASATPSTQAFGDAAAVGTGDTFTRGDHKHAMPAAPTTIANDTLWAAKGDLVAATANDTAAVLTAGANDTILMADSAQTTGLKWVASATPSTQAFGDAAAVGTADTFTRGDHKHAMPADPVTQEAPSAFSYNSGWADVGSGWQAGRYWKDPFGNVHLEGLITRTNLATMTIATLPAGYRPSATLQFLVDRDGVDGFMNLASTGTLVIGGADATIGGLSLSGITFRAA
jgi:hypothetical protein